MNTTTAVAVPAKPTEPKSKGSSQTKEKYPMDGQHVLEGSHPG